MTFAGNPWATTESCGLNRTFLLRANLAKDPVITELEAAFTTGTDTVYLFDSGQVDFTDISTGNRVIPEYQYLIVDEAHHLESATTMGLSFRVSEGEFRKLLNDLGASKPGILQGIEDSNRIFFNISTGVIF